MTDNQYYVVKAGTNMREIFTEHDVVIPKVFDSLEIAQLHADDSMERDASLRLPRYLLAPIEVSEYDKKYSKYSSVANDTGGDQ